MAKSKASVKIPDEIVMNKIYLIRGQKVMLDSDLAALYGVETKVLNQAVKRNINRFPEDFMFTLTAQEHELLRSQIVTLEKGILKSQIVTSRWGGKRKLPSVFTEHGVLSSVLNSNQAITVNIQIMRIFTRIRQILLDNTELRLEIEKIKKKLDNHDKNMEVVFQYLDELLEKKEKPRKQIGYKIKATA